MIFWTILIKSNSQGKLTLQSKSLFGNFSVREIVYDKLVNIKYDMICLKISQIILAFSLGLTIWYMQIDDIMFCLFIIYK